MNRVWKCEPGSWDLVAVSFKRGNEPLSIQGGKFLDNLSYYWLQEAIYYI